MTDHATYAREQDEKLDVKVRELRAEGWDVLPRRERDKALGRLDDANDEIERLTGVLARLADLTDGLPFDEADDDEQLIERAIHLAHAR